MFTQPRDPNNKNKPAYKNIVHTVIEQITPSLLVSKSKEMMKTNGMLKLDQNLHKTQKSFVQYFRSPSHDRTKVYDTRYRSRSTSRTNSYNKYYSKNRYRPTSSDRFSYDENTTSPQYSRSRYENYKRDSRSYHSPYRSSYRSPYRHNSRPRYRSRSNSRDNDNFTKYTTYTDHLQDQEILDFLDADHTQILEIKLNDTITKPI